MGTGASILYVTYDGLTDPLGRSQVLPYLVRLSKRGHRISILSCEKSDREAKDGARIAAICEAAEIEWHRLRYHRKPPVLSSAWDSLALRRAAARLHRRKRFDIVHCRSYIPAEAGLLLKRRHSVRFLFDTRGFWPDEKVEGGNWPQSNPVFRAVYRYFKRREAEFLRHADHVITLTEAGAAELCARPDFGHDRISVIPCCVDFQHFDRPSPESKREQREALGLPADAPVLAYLGSLGGNYMLDELIDFFRVYREVRPGARFLFVTRDSAEPILAAAAAKGVAASEIAVRPASREEVPLFTGAADLGVAFKKPVFSSKGCSPTKLGEMLALGLPVVANDGVGDVAPILADTGAGVTLIRFDPASYRTAIDKVEKLGMSPEQIREKAVPWFDLEIGIARYDSIYRALVGSTPAAEKAASNRARNSSAE